MISAAAWIALLVAAGFAAPQAQAIARYSAVEASPERAAFRPAMPLDDCANSRRGEGLLGVTKGLRWDLHIYGEKASWECIPPETQAAYLAWAFPAHYPGCAARFAAGELGAFRRCWGGGRGR